MTSKPKTHYGTYANFHHWNYRLMPISKDFTELGVFEVYYNAKGKPVSRTEHPTLIGENKEDILSELKMMVQDIKKHKSIDFFE